MKRIIKKLVVNWFLLTLGAVIAAFAIEEFLVPCTILDGGVVGIGIMVNSMTGLSLSALTIIFNIPFLIIGLFKISYIFVAKSAYAMVVFSVFLDVFSSLRNITEENLLAVCFGGVILGAGVGLVIRSGGCLDGTESVSIIISRKFGLSVGKMVLIFNVIIFAVAAFLLGFDRAMYSLLTYFITSRIIDVIESGLEKTKAAMIITDAGKEMADTIYKKLGRTVTLMEGEGLVSGKKVVLYCVLNRFEVHELRRIAEAIDTSCFISVSDVSEIIGIHMKKVDKRVTDR